MQVIRCIIDRHLIKDILYQIIEGMNSITTEVILIYFHLQVNCLVYTSLEKRNAIFRYIPFGVKGSHELTCESRKNIFIFYNVNKPVDFTGSKPV